MFVKENKSEGRNCKSAIALTCILDKHFAKAVSLLEDMKQQRSLTTARDHFLLYKAYVLLGDDLKSSATIKDMMEADDFHGDYLTLSATEAINASLNKVGINSQEASALIVVTQHYDTLQAMGSNSRSNLILLPNSPSNASDMMNEMITSFSAASIMGNEMNKGNVQIEGNDQKFLKGKG